MPSDQRCPDCKRVIFGAGSDEPGAKCLECSCSPSAFEGCSVTDQPTMPPFDYELLGKEIGRLVNTKQAAYGDSFGKCGDVMRILYPEGIPPEKLGDALAVVRVLDKLFRIATDRDALGETPWRDVAGYALLSAARVEAKR